MNNARSITAFMNPRATFPSQYGEVTAAEWCRLEVERIRAKGGRACVVTALNGNVAIKRPASDVIVSEPDAEDAS